MLTPEQGERVKRIFWEAIELPAAERQAYVKRECPDDPSIHDEVLSLLHSAEYQNGPLDLGPDAFDAALAAKPEFSPGTQIGRYQVIDLIGQGGMGDVYKAQQLRPITRTVALKLIQPQWNSAAILSRFQMERETLASMNHPNIATVFDADKLDDGHPYFAMEYVPGTRISTFCDKNKYSVRQRLDLFLQVCGAIQHAHQKGVIHRDLKPSNLLVMEVDHGPVVKVIDFGVAKAIWKDVAKVTQVSLPGQFLGTFAYMSPEQLDSASGVDTRTDIYALGLVLYELLSNGVPAQDVTDKSLTAITEVILKKAPARLNVINSSIEDDLATVVAKAIEKDRNDRYANVSDLSGDIQRFLTNKPVHAKPPTTWYRARKFAVRNKLLVVSSTVILFVMLLGFIGTSFGYVNTERQKRRTEAALIESEVKQAALESQRGNWTRSLELYRGAKFRGHPDPVAIEIKIIESLDALNRRGEAVTETDKLVASDAAREPRYYAKTLLLQAEAARLRGDKRARKLLEEAKGAGLQDADLCYAQAMLASNSEQVIVLLRAAISKDQFHRLSLSALPLTYLALGRLDEARDAAKIAAALLPNDPVPEFVFAIVSGLRGDLRAQNVHLQRLRELTDAKTLMLATGLCSVSTKLNHQVESWPMTGPTRLQWISLVMPLLAQVTTLIASAPQHDGLATPLLAPLPDCIAQAYGDVLTALNPIGSPVERIAAVRRASEAHPDAVFWLIRWTIAASDANNPLSMHDNVALLETALQHQSLVPALKPKIHMILVGFRTAEFAIEAEGPRKEELRRLAIRECDTYLKAGGRMWEFGDIMSEIGKKLGDSELRRAILESWRHQNPDSLAPISHLAEFQCDQGAYLRAIQLADRVLVLDSANPVALNVRSRAIAERAAAATQPIPNSATPSGH